MNRIVSLEWLMEHLNDPNLVIVDCRFALGKPDAGRAVYEEGHIPGAFYVDLEQDMSGPKTAHGGRHPLPDLGVFSLLMGELGIDDSITVVAYDDQGGAMASRFWWMLHFLGHERTVILDKGFTAWRSAAYPVTADPTTSPAKRTFGPRVQNQLLVSMDGVKSRLGQTGTVLLDSREKPRYLGLEEAIDPVAGHIPGAVNSFWKDSLRVDGSWKDAGEQRERFEHLPKEKEIVVYCGSGVTACPNVLSLMEAGFKNVKLYGGSWSDWISYSDNPIATGEE